MLAASHERFRAVVQGAPDGIVISRDGVVLYANDAAVRLLGYDDASELVGRPMTFLDPEGLAVMRQRLEQMAATGERLPPKEYAAIRRDGARITAEIASIVVDFDGAPAVLAYARDVTERARLRAQLAHADRLASLGVLSAGVAHEINNPLSYVSLAAQMLSRRLLAAGVGPEDLKLLEDVRTGVDRIAAIVRDLKCFGRFEDEALSTVDLGAAIDAAERLVHHELKPKATLKRRYDSPPTVLGVAQRIEQVFVNLLLNAVQAMPDDRSDGEIVIAIETTRDEVLVEVRDSGKGIEPDRLSLVFEPFYTSRPGTGGTGLGLSICRDIALRAGGDLTATSEVGSGTTMRLRLRRPSSDAVAVRERPAVVPTATRRLRVLVVDDEPLIVSSTTTTLVGNGFDVVGENDATRALERLLADDSFDAVVCDLMMPGLTGMDLHARVAQARPGHESRFVFVTGGAYTSRARAFLERSPNERLTKPYVVDQLVAAIRRAAG